MSKQWGRFFQILRVSQKVWTLNCVNVTKIYCQKTSVIAANSLKTLLLLHSWQSVNFKNDLRGIDDWLVVILAVEIFAVHVYIARNSNNFAAWQHIKGKIEKIWQCELIYRSLSGGTSWGRKKPTKYVTFSVAKRDRHCQRCNGIISSGAWHQALSLFYAVLLN